MSERRDFFELMDYLGRVERLDFSRRRFLGMIAGATAGGSVLASCGGGADEQQAGG